MAAKLTVNSNMIGTKGGHVPPKITKNLALLQCPVGHPGS